MKEYFPRIADILLEDELEATGAVLIEGPKWCGKTTTASQRAKSILKMQQPGQTTQLLMEASVNPTGLLAGDTPRLIDEWQMAPILWDAIRYEVDERGKPGQFILTGSATPPDRSKIKHSGTGRIARLRMLPMSLYESGESSGMVSLERLFAGTVLNAADDAVSSRVPQIRNSSPTNPVSGARLRGNADFSAHLAALSLERLAFLVCRGGWPQSVTLSERAGLRQARNYLDAVVETDISEADGVRRDANVAREILRSYARLVSSQGTEATIVSDIRSAIASRGESTVKAYLRALREIYVLQDLKAWSPRLRSKTAIRQAPTRHFADPSIPCAALGIGPADLVGDLNTFGLVFEDLCVRDLRAYASLLDGDIYHYRDKTGLECDAVIHLWNGRYGLVEFKLGGDDLIAEGVKSLRKLVGRIDEDVMGAPSFCMVLTGVNSRCFTDESGIHIVPINHLGP